MKKLFTLLTLALFAVSGAWAADLVEKYQLPGNEAVENGYLTTISVDGTNAVYNSRRIKVGNGSTGTFTIATNSTVTSFKIKSITLKEYSNNKISALKVSDVDVPKTDTENRIYTYTAGSNETSVTFTMSGSGGNAEISEIAITLTDGNDEDCESLIPASGKKDALVWSSTLSPSLATITGSTDNVKFATSNGTSVIEVKQNDVITISATKAIKAIYFSFTANIPTWTVPEGTTYTAASHCWTPANTTTTSVQLTKSSGSTTRISNIHIVYQPSGPQDGVFTISKSTLEVGETAKILLDGNDNFSTYFTAGTFWESVATGPYVTLGSDGSVTAIKPTPEGYYFTFTALTKDLEKYNTTTGNSITVTVTAPKCATPTIYPADGGTFVGANSVTINTETEGASIYYTLDGTTPTSASALYDPADKPTITTTTTVKAIAVKADYDDSDVATAKITKVITSTVNDWNFTNWSDATKTGVQADATNWFNKEADGKQDFTVAGHIGRSNMNALDEATLKYSETNIAETDGLKFTAPVTSMALMFDQPSALGDYNGNQYIWLYGKNSKIIIENVPAGATIRMGVETHKTSTGTDGRGVDLSGSAGITLTEGVAKPTGYSDNEWSVPNGGDITVTPNVGGCHIYYITVKRNKEIENVSSFGWSTYITKTAVAFDANTAYVITNVKGSSITTEAVTSVPANTAVLLKDEGEKTIDPQTSASDPETNLLSVCNGTANGTKVPYVLAKDGASAGFKKWTGDIAKLNGRAVLWLDAEVASRDFFDLDGTTSINKVESANAATVNQYYNLAGQRVAQPTKGLYIVNGKKVIIK